MFLRASNLLFMHSQEECKSYKDIWYTLHVNCVFQLMAWTNHLATALLVGTVPVVRTLLNRLPRTTPHLCLTARVLWQTTQAASAGQEHTAPVAPPTQRSAMEVHSVWITDCRHPKGFVMQGMYTFCNSSHKGKSPVLKKKNHCLERFIWL